MVPFKVPCGKCAECLLEKARDWSVRCIHEASIHEESCFITLTYADENLPQDRKVRHLDFQLFMKRLRKMAGEGIGYFMCGEYGEETHRPHYHACIFGYDFKDKVKFRENKHGDTIWKSKILDELWGLGHTELGSVTQRSAGYVARYVLKKQKGPEGSYQKMSRQNAIGKRWIEKNWRDVFIHANGSVVLSDGTKTKVPRYYEKWLKKNQPETWLCYITNQKPENQKRLEKKAVEEHAIYISECENRKLRAGNYKTPLARKREIIKQKQQLLKREYL